MLALLGERAPDGRKSKLNVSSLLVQGVLRYLGGRSLVKLATSLDCGEELSTPTPIGDVAEMKPRSLTGPLESCPSTIKPTACPLPLATLTMSPRPARKIITGNAPIARPPARSLISLIVAITHLFFVCSAALSLKLDGVWPLLKDRAFNPLAQR
ncbi:MAG: hypothetical protein H0W92_05375 [Sphingomonas sp.]|nr:hypothetical protein [Sphingomonas sp.]